ncbi:Hypothetical_protein [Hexamita inflata]|uniref:Hypothetical_protein n=1 Tax=Hexamita inflata TaxID=28002 RepID=A0AA86USF8_9EUKA|nr:Hypothetical protein HINF_LOCUS57585 [Hexamita inflata]
MLNSQFKQYKYVNCYSKYNSCVIQLIDLNQRLRYLQHLLYLIISQQFCTLQAYIEQYNLHPNKFAWFQPCSKLLYKLVLILGWGKMRQFLTAGTQIFHWDGYRYNKYSYILKGLIISHKFYSHSMYPGMYPI